MEKVGIKNLIQKDCENLYVIHADLGMVYAQKKEYKKALECFKKALNYSFDLYSYLTKDENTTQEVLNILESQIDGIKSNFIDISIKLGDNEFENNSIETALDYYTDILNFEPYNPNVYRKISKCLVELEAFASAVSLLEKISLLNPNDYELYAEMGEIYENKLQQYQSAINCYTKYLEKKPNSAKINYQIGIAYQRINEFKNLDEQIKHLEKSIKLMPDLKVAIRNIAFVYQRAEKYKEAIDSYKKLIKLGARIDDYFNFSLLLIQLKDFKEGWKYYDYRFTMEHNPTNYPEINKPKWNGEKIKDKTLLIRYEQGLGDTFMFARYIEQVKPLVGKIIFAVQDSLFDLIKENLKGVEVIKKTTPLENIKFDYHVPLMSLMHILDKTVDDIPAKDGYIKADQKLVKKYKEEFFNNDCFKIGISWNGQETGNKSRDIPLECFYPLTKLKNVKVYAFQRGFGAKQLFNKPTDIDIISLGQTFNDFSDTAAAMENLDLFITSDNVLLNLFAGAMGKKTFLLLNKNAEWRWFNDDKTTPWFNSVRLFKKKNIQDSWESVIEKVIEELNTQIKNG